LLRIGACLHGAVGGIDRSTHLLPSARRALIGNPEALADVLLFLCSPAARAIHGAAIPVVGLS
jgi:NAD(P)-dependent dehydrogenase (short-subunit alcohol dehydrogenase family)